MRWILVLVLLSMLVMAACVTQFRGSREASLDKAATVKPIKETDNGMQYEEATFAAGCFWGVEAAFRKVDGVVGTEVGYSGGHTENPDYEQVCTDRTGHAESVKVRYDPKKVSYAELLDAFWSCHDPTTLNRQGPDVGSQYRSVIFCHNPEQERVARESLKEVEEAGVFTKAYVGAGAGRKIVTEIRPAQTFYSAELYHQQYFEKLGQAASCHVGVAVVHTKLAEGYRKQRGQ